MTPVIAIMKSTKDLIQSDTDSFVAQSIKTERFANTGFERSCSNGPIDLVYSNETGNAQQGPDNDMLGFTFKDDSIGQQLDVVDEMIINPSNGCSSTNSAHVSTVNIKSSSPQGNAFIGQVHSANKDHTQHIVSSAMKCNKCTPPHRSITIVLIVWVNFYDFEGL